MGENALAMLLLGIAIAVAVLVSQVEFGFKGHVWLRKRAWQKREEVPAAPHRTIIASAMDHAGRR